MSKQEPEWVEVSEDVWYLETETISILIHPAWMLGDVICIGQVEVFGAKGDFRDGGADHVEHFMVTREGIFSGCKGPLQAWKLEEGIRENYPRTNNRTDTPALLSAIHEGLAEALGHLQGMFPRQFDYGVGFKPSFWDTW